LKQIVILSTDTCHHRYFINRLLRERIPIKAVIYETSQVKPPFKTGPFFEEEQNRFECIKFFSEVSHKLPASIKTYRVRTVNTKEAKDIITGYKPDLGIVFGCGKIGLEVINSVKDGLINVHRGIAGKYRGLDSDLWAVYHNDFENIGVTIHKVDQDLDTGDIARCARLTLKKGTGVYQLRYFTTLLAADLVIGVVKKYLKNNRLYLRRQKKKGRYYSFMPLKYKRVAAGRFDKFMRMKCRP
jgi:methionyl-tRNA formyltransferase